MIVNQSTASTLRRHDMNSIDDYPNVLVVPDNRETPDDIIEDYVELIQEIKDDKDFLRETLQMLFDDVNFWTLEQSLIDQARVCLGQLQELHECVFEDEDD